MGSNDICEHGLFRSLCGTCSAASEPMEHQFKIGDSVLFFPIDKTPTYMATVTRVLDDDERDPEVGPMYEVTLVCQAFEDELTHRQADAAS